MCCLSLGGVYGFENAGIECGDLCMRSLMRSCDVQSVQVCSQVTPSKRSSTRPSTRAEYVLKYARTYVCEYGSSTRRVQLPPYTRRSEILVRKQEVAYSYTTVLERII